MLNTITYLMKQLQNFRDKIRISDTMNEMAAELKDDEIAALAEHFSKQPALSHRIRSSKKSLAAVGFYIFHEGNAYAEIPPCAACHGAVGISPNSSWPNLAGQQKAYLVKQMKAFRDGKRSDPWMSPMATVLSDEDIADLADFFNSLPVRDAYQ